MEDQHRFATLAVHAGEAPCKVTGAVDTPIYQSTTFAAEDSDEMAALYSGEKPGYMYTRYGNPTVHALEEKVAALEGGEAAQAFATGMAAVSSSILACVKAGDHVVAARSFMAPRTIFSTASSRPWVRPPRLCNPRAPRISRRPFSPTRG